MTARDKAAALAAIAITFIGGCYVAVFQHLLSQ